MASCWYCQAKTNSALYLPDGSEVWCCANCYKKHGRIRKHIVSVNPSQDKPKQTVFSPIHTEKKEEKGIINDKSAAKQATLDLEASSEVQR